MWRMSRSPGLAVCSRPVARWRGAAQAWLSADPRRPPTTACRSSPCPATWWTRPTTLSRPRAWASASRSTWAATSRPTRCTARCCACWPSRASARPRRAWRRACARGAALPPRRPSVRGSAVCALRDTCSSRTHRPGLSTRFCPCLDCGRGFWCTMIGYPELHANLQDHQRSSMHALDCWDHLGDRHTMAAPRGPPRAARPVVQPCAACLRAR